MSTNPPPQDILKRFPYEIWSKCILDAIYRAPDGPLPLLSVSSLWQKSLLDSPEMWSYIHIDEGEDVDARIHIFLVLSGHHPLEMAIAFNEPIWARMKSIIAAHKERIHSIYVLGWLNLRPRGGLVPSILDNVTFPEVRTIDGVISRFDASTFDLILISCPKLEYVMGTVFYGSDNATKNLSERLRAVYIELYSEPIESLESRLRAFLSLEYLEYLIISIPDIKPSPNSSTTHPATTPLNNYALSSTRLRELTISTQIRSVLQGILGSSLGYLQSLVIFTEASHLDIVVGAFPSLPSLRHIWLGFMLDRFDPERVPRLHQSHIPLVKNFTIYVDSTSQPSFHPILDALTRSDGLAGIEIFKLICDPAVGSASVINVAGLIYSLRNCISIALPTLKDHDPAMERDSSIVFPILMPNLLSLEITDLTTIPVIEAPSLHYLRVSRSSAPRSAYPINHFGRSFNGSDITGEVPKIPPLSPINLWDTVQHIQWGSYESFIGLKTTGFRSIRSVEFLHHSEDIYNQFHAFNGFLVALLRYPDACPQLVTIKSREYPMWSLFAQVLRQRNRNTNVDQLQEIWVPGLPVLDLLRPVIALLDGEQSMAIPYNVDHIILRRFEHDLIASCTSCIRSGYTQCPNYANRSPQNFSELWWQQKEDGSMHDRRSDADYLELLELPSNSPPVQAEDSDFNLSWTEWEERLQRLTTDCRRESRRWTCHRDHTKLIRIHKHMLCD